jgi:hypothetical protein
MSLSPVLTPIWLSHAFHIFLQNGLSRDALRIRQNGPRLETPARRAI